MASKNPGIDLDIYTQLNTSLSSFDGFTQSDINNHPNADMDLDVYRQLNDSTTSSEGFTQSDLTYNNNLDNETLSNLSSNGEVQIDTSDEIDNCELSLESNIDENNYSYTNETDSKNSPGTSGDGTSEHDVGENSSSDRNDSDSDGSESDSDTDSDTSHGENVDTDGLANNPGTPDELFGLLNSPINWKSNNFNNIEINILCKLLMQNYQMIGMLRIPNHWHISSFILIRKFWKKLLKTAIYTMGIAFKLDASVIPITEIRIGQT